jgi:hypothetical protein
VRVERFRRGDQVGPGAAYRSSKDPSVKNCLLTPPPGLTPLEVRGVAGGVRPGSVYSLDLSTASYKIYSVPNLRRTSFPYAPL